MPKGVCPAYAREEPADGRRSALRQRVARPSPPSPAGPVGEVPQNDRDDCHREGAPDSGGSWLTIAKTTPLARYCSAMCGYSTRVGGTKFSAKVRIETHRRRFAIEPALSLVPDARAPPKGCWPTTAPVGLSLT